MKRLAPKCRTVRNFLVTIAAAAADRILPVTQVAPQELWDHLWPREGTTAAPSVTAPRLLEAARASAHYPVLPEPAVLWQALQEGARENRWVLYLRGPGVAVGAGEMNEWPGTPRFDAQTEFWAYQAALDGGLYPRKKGPGPGPKLPLTPDTIRQRCWPTGTAEIATEELERAARGVWPDLSRPALETALREGLRAGTWAAWRKDPDGTFFTRGDLPAPAVTVGPGWALVAPASPLAKDLDDLRPGRGPQPIVRSGVPREALTAIADELARSRNLLVAQLDLTALDRPTFDNTLLVTWADRPPAAQAHVSVSASGQRVVGGKTETVNLTYEGRFEEVRALLAPVWPFQNARAGEGNKGDLAVSIALVLKFDPPLPPDDPGLATYRTALMNANQGSLEIRLVPVRPRKGGGG